MTTYALDTNIISYFLRGDIKITNEVRAIAKAGDTINIPPIVYYEIRRGLLDTNAFSKMDAFKDFCAIYTVGTINKHIYETAAALSKIQTSLLARTASGTAIPLLQITKNTLSPS
ncbi:MAG: PIN domain-containing protein, partial [Spirochaetales bacterium]|nr:PIN domain-containing protein [Spirochaetales bacterium]